MPPIIRVVRAEAVYTPPPPEPVTAWSGVPAAELVYLYMETRTQRRITRPTEPTGDTYYARINQNRWVADCYCGSAQVVSPTDPRYGCVECGWGWSALIFPADATAVETQVMLEPRPALRNWWHADDPLNPVQPDPDPGPEPEPEPPEEEP
ncbi:hypothetical protein IFE09_11390 [Streptomyces microflavus]|nr:hypothetical protein [Streptomyces microflavus]QQZ54159.1 hypothetical protein IFE09_11390 [Streptomyces microflavus]